MAGGRRFQSALVDVLEDPESSASELSSLVALLDHEDRTVRVGAAWGICVIVSENPETIARAREEVRAEAESAEAAVVQQWLRTGAPPEPEAELTGPSPSGEGSSDGSSGDSGPDQGSADTSSGARDEQPRALGDGVVEDGRFTVPLADTRLEGFELVERTEAIDHRRTYVGLATIDGEQEAVWLRTYPTPDGVVEESFRDTVGAAIDRWTGLTRYEHVLNVHDWGRRPTPWAVLEYASNPLYAADRPELDDALDIALGLAQGLAHAHDNGIVHGSFDPGAAAFVPGDGERLAAVESFGIGQAYRSVSAPVPLDARYAAPEQFDEEFGSIDRRTDVYHLGGVLYTLLTGMPPRATAFDQERLESPPDPPVPSLDDDRLPEQTDSIVAKAMAPRKIARYESIDATVSDLRGLLDSRTNT